MTIIQRPRTFSFDESDGSEVVKATQPVGERGLGYAESRSAECSHELAALISAQSSRSPATFSFKRTSVFVDVTEVDTQHRAASTRPLRLSGD